MESYSLENPTPDKPEKDSSADSKKAKKESLSGLLGRSLESAKKEEAARDIAESSLWEKLTAKPEKGEAAKPEKPSVEAKEEPVSEEATPSAEAAIEIPLDDPTRAAATEYIDLRHDAVIEEQIDLNPATPEATAVQADASLLETAREQISEAPDGSSFTEAIDTAYSEVAQEIEAAAAAPAPELAPQLDPSIVAEHYAQEQASGTPAPAEKPAAETAQQPWYGLGSQERRFYPGSWPPQPVKSPLETAGAELATGRKVKKAAEKAAEQVAGAQKHEQEQAIQQYIDRKEQAIRSKASEAFATQRQPETTPQSSYVAPEHARPAPLPAVEVAPQTAKSETQASQAAERVQRMEHHELLAVAEKVIIDGTSLRTIYEAKQITEPGLRRIAREYLRGGDVKAALNHELVLKEMTYERDPQMRDRLAASYESLDAASAQTSRDGLAGLQAQATQPASSQQPIQNHAVPAANDSPAKRVLVSAWVALVVVLVVVAVVLLLR